MNIKCKIIKEKIIYNYITTNNINGKQYVGMHYTNDVDDGYLGSGKALIKAIKKYGKENFTREILCICKTIEEAHSNEEIFIKKYNTRVPYGYNIHPKGGGIITLNKVSERTKRQDDFFEHCPEILQQLKDDFIIWQNMLHDNSEWTEEKKEKCESLMLSFGWNRKTKIFENEKLMYKLIEYDYEKRRAHKK